MVCTPNGKVEPEAIPELIAIVLTLQLSEAVASLYVTTLPDTEVAVSVMLLGQLIAGSVLSITVTVKVQSSLLTEFVAVAVTVVIPTEKSVPEFGV